MTPRIPIEASRDNPRSLRSELNRTTSRTERANTRISSRLTFPMTSYRHSRSHNPRRRTAAMLVSCSEAAWLLSRNSVDCGYSQSTCKKLLERGVECLDVVRAGAGAAGEMAPIGLDDP